MKILVVAAHPDDEVLGCGGTIARLADEGHDVYTLHMTRGRGPKQLRGIADSAPILSVAGGEVFDLPDNRMDLRTIRTITVKLERAGINSYDRIYTHHPGDLNIDHQITARAVLTATRPQPGCKVKEIFAFEVPSSTEWNFGTSQPFVPNVYVDLGHYIHKKLAALKCYESEMRDEPHPRSPLGVNNLAERRGFECGAVHAEAFMLLRGIY